MKNTITTIILLMTVGMFITMPAWAFDGRNAYEAGDGHWIYFGPEPSSDWTTQRAMPLKRSLDQSIRRDALRHYEMPRHELPESGEMIVFYSEKRRSSAQAAIPPVMRKPNESKWEVFELPESGHTIRFTKEKTAPSADETIVARQNDGPS